MRKPEPLNMMDVASVAQWVANTRAMVDTLHEVALDATAKDRVFSRLELRRRACKVSKALRAQLDALGVERVDPVAYTVR
jgi:hypothetical protein